jgi:hypothetical protein
MTNDFISNLQDFLDEERMEMKLWEASPLEFWVLSMDDSVSARFILDNSTREVSYDVFSTTFSGQLEEETQIELENANSVTENHRKWGFTAAAEDLGIILDEIKILAQKKKFSVKWKKII